MAIITAVRIEAVSRYTAMAQSLPTRHTEWPDSVQAKTIEILPPNTEWIAQLIKRRAEVGYETYGTYLGVGNPGRDGDIDLVEELADALVYAQERYLATHRKRYSRAWELVLAALKELAPEQ